MSLDTRYLRRAFATNDDTWYEVYKTTCPVCGNVGYCMINEVGTKAVCMRVESKTVFSKKNNSYLHFLDEKVKITGKKETSLPQRVKPEDSILDARYRVFLQSLKVNINHAEHLLKERGLAPETVKYRQYRSYPVDTVAGAKALIGEQLFDSERFKSKDYNIGFPGLYLNNGQWDMVQHDGILIPYRNMHMEIVGFQIRATNVKNRVIADRRNFEGLKVFIKKEPNYVMILDDGEIIHETYMEIGEKLEIKHGDKHTIVKLEKGQRYLWLSSANKYFGTAASSQESPLPIHVAIPTKKLIQLDPLIQQQIGNSDYLVNIETNAAWITEGARETCSLISLAA